MSTKRIWLVNLFFGAGIAPTGAFLESVAERLKREGWQVEILAGNVAYNRGQGAGFGGRLVSWMLFYLRTALFAFTHRLPDKVLIMTTPPFMHLIFATRNWFARRKAELILWNQDTYPEVLAAVGMIRPKSLIYKMLLALERWGIQRADKVIALDRAMQQILENHGGKQVHVIPNWEIELGKGEELTNRALTECIEAAKANFRYLVLYTGNYGWGHDLSTLFEYLRMHPEQRSYYFLFVGGGEIWRQLETFREESRIECIGVFPYVPKSQMGALLKCADFGLVTLTHSCVGLMSPSKIHGYLLCCKPLIYLGPAGSNVADAIEDFHCGLRVDERDAAAFEHCLNDIASGTIDIAGLGQNALKAAALRYTEPVGVRDVVEFVLR